MKNRMFCRRTRPTARRRAVTTIVAAVLLVALTVVAGAVLWAMTFRLPSATATVEYVAVGDQSEPVWGDCTDCNSCSTGVVIKCDVLPATYIVFTSHSPDPIPLSSLSFEFTCNGTSYLNASLDKMEMLPGQVWTPGPSSPSLGRCGTFDPHTLKHVAKIWFNRLAFFRQVSPNATVLKNGDAIVVYIDSNNSWVQHDTDDFHGVPPWCFTVVNACTIYIGYSGPPAQIIAAVPMTALSGFGTFTAMPYGP
jgi:hypothetical protein